MTFPRNQSDTAQVQVQKQAAIGDGAAASGSAATGLTVAKSARISPWCRAGIHRRQPRQDDLGDYMASQIQDPLSRVTGVGDTQVLRIAIRHAGLARSAQDGQSADYRRRRDERCGGAERSGFGRPDRRSADGQGPEAQRHRQRSVATPEPRGIPPDPAATNTDGSIVKLGDVARVEMAAEREAYIARYNGKPATGLAIKLAPGATPWPPSRRSRPR